MTGSSKIVIDSSSTGPVEIYADGDVSAAGQGIQNTSNIPFQFQLYGTGGSSQDISLSGGNSFYGVVYAPDADLELTGIADACGQFIAGTAEVKGTTAVHGDEALREQEPPHGSDPKLWPYVPNVWQEIIP